MSDDLVERLRESGSRSEIEIHEDREEAADRIAGLEDENKRLRLEAAHANDTADAAIERAKEREAKLAKAVDAFTRIDDLTCHNMPMTAREEQAVNREARAALAELKGQADD